jgi:hypothetical protein
MKKISLVFVIFSILFIVSCSKTSAPVKTVKQYMSFLKKGNFAAAWNMLDDETKKVVGKETFQKQAERIKSLSSFIKLKPAQINKDKTRAIINTVFWGEREAFNKMPEMKITFYVNKYGDNWKIRLQKTIEMVKNEKKKDSVEIPIDPTMIETAKKYKDKIEVKNLQEGEVTFMNGLSQYMMQATIKNNSDKPFSYIGLLVKFMNDDESKVLFSKTFFLIYTRQIEAIYPLKPGESRDVMIPGYDPADFGGGWTGKLQYEINAVKIATPEELITLDDLK